jgi:hypothetical protein
MACIRAKAVLLVSLYFLKVSFIEHLIYDQRQKQEILQNEARKSTTLTLASCPPFPHTKHSFPVGHRCPKCPNLPQTKHGRSFFGWGQFQALWPVSPQLKQRCSFSSGGSQYLLPRCKGGVKLLVWVRLSVQHSGEQLRRRSIPRTDHKQLL